MVKYLRPHQIGYSSRLGKSEQLAGSRKFREEETSASVYGALIKKHSPRDEKSAPASDALSRKERNVSQEPQEDLLAENKDVFHTDDGLVATWSIDVFPDNKLDLATYLQDNKKEILSLFKSSKRKSSSSPRSRLEEKEKRRSENTPSSPMVWKRLKGLKKIFSKWLDVYLALDNDAKIKEADARRTNELKKCGIPLDKPFTYINAAGKSIHGEIVAFSDDDAGKEVIFKPSTGLSFSLSVRSLSEGVDRARAALSSVSQESEKQEVVPVKKVKSTFIVKKVAKSVQSSMDIRSDSVQEPSLAKPVLIKKKSVASATTASPTPEITEKPSFDKKVQNGKVVFVKKHT